jgi:hypothetical protein
MAKKATNIETINAIIEKYGIEGTDKEFLDHEIALIAKRNEYKSVKPTKKQVENAGLKEQLVALMEEGKTYTATDLTNLLGIEGMSVQRVSALLKQLKEAGEVVTGVIKRRTYFGLPGTEFAPTAEADAE